MKKLLSVLITSTILSCEGSLSPVYGMEPEEGFSHPAPSKQSMHDPNQSAMNPQLIAKACEIKKPMDSFHFFRIVGLLPENDQDEKNFNLLIDLLNNGLCGLQVIDALKKIPPDDRIDVLLNAKSIITHIPKKNLSHLVGSIGSLQKDKRDEKTLLLLANLLNFEGLFFTENVPGFILKEIPADNLDDVLLKAKSIITHVKENKHFSFILTMSNLSKNNRDENTLMLLNDLLNIDGLSQDYISSALKEVSEDDQVDVLLKTKSMITNVQRRKRDNFILAVSKLSKNNRDKDTLRVLNDLLNIDGLSGHYINSALKKVSEDDQVDVLLKTKSMITEVEKSNRDNFILAVSELSKNNRDKDTLILLSDLLNIEGVSGYFFHSAVKEIPANNQVDVLLKTKSMITNVEESRRDDFILAVSELSKSNRYKDALILLVDLFNIKGISGFTISATLKDIPVDDRVDLLADLLLKVKPMIANVRDEEHIHIFNLMGLLPKNQRDKETLTLLSDLFNRHHHTDNITRDFINLISQNSTFKDKLFRGWTTVFEQCSHSPYVKHIADFVLENYEAFGLFETHELVQFALRASILLENSNDPLNPYNFHKALLKKREEKIDLSRLKLPQETFAGQTIRLNPAFFQQDLSTFSNSSKVKFRDLPPYSKNGLKDLVDALDKKAQTDPNVDHKVRDITGFSYDQLKQGSLSDGYLQLLLDFSGKEEEPAPLIKARFIEIINYIWTLSSETKDNHLLSEREEALIKILASIRDCSTGKEEGINGAYLYFVPEKSRHPYPQEHKSPYDKLFEGFATKVEKMFSGQNFFTKYLIGMNYREDVKQAAHQAKYLKNLIGKDVGLRDELRFDINTQTLYKEMVDKTKEQVLQEFYTCFPPRYILDITKVLGDLEDDHDAIRILEKLRVIEVVKKMSPIQSGKEELE